VAEAISPGVLSFLFSEYYTEYANRRDNVMDETTTPSGEPTIHQVIEQLLDTVDGSEALPDKITLQQGTPFEWACRVYHPNGQDFDGYILSFPRPE
jgi:hypothetical protein